MASPFTPDSIPAGGSGGSGGSVTQGTDPWLVDASGAALPVEVTTLPLPASAAKDTTLTDGSQRVGGTVTVTGPLTDAQLRAVPVPVSGTFFQGTQPVSGPLTDTQLRASVVPIGDGGGSLTVDGSVSVGNTPSVNQGTTPWKAREDTAAMTWMSLKSAAPSASAVQADTGALAAGDYDFDIELLASDVAAVGKGLVVEHRNAANAATLQTLGGCAVPGQVELHLRRYTMASNERLRVIAGTAAGAASSMYVSAIGRRVA